MKMPFTASLRAAAIASALAIFLYGALAAQTAPAQGTTLASLNEDVQILAREVNRLRLEVESLRQANENLQKQLLTQREVQNLIQNAVAASRADSRADLAATRKDIADAVARQIEALAKTTDEQLKKLAKAIQDTPAKGSTVGPPPTPRKFDTNFPTTGIEYTVKPGEYVSQIARQHNSTIEWIRNANEIENINDVRAGTVIFIPQKPAGNATPGNTTAGN